MLELLSFTMNRWLAGSLPSRATVGITSMRMGDPAFGCVGRMMASIISGSLSLVIVGQLEKGYGMRTWSNKHLYRKVIPVFMEKYRTL